MSFAYPTLQQAGPSFAYLGLLIRDLSKWDIENGTNHIWTCWGYLQGTAIGQPDSPTVPSQVVTPELLAASCEAIAARASTPNSPTSQAIGNGILLKLIGGLITKLIESGFIQEKLMELLKGWLGGIEKAG